MPAKSEKQRRAACAEVSRRKRGKKRSKKGRRPFSNAALESVLDFCRGKAD